MGSKNSIALYYSIFTTIILILSFLKGNKQIYHISRIIKESGEDFPDQTNIIYVNTSKSSSNDLGKLIEDFYTADPEKMHSKILAKRVSRLKIAENLEKGDEKAMTTYYDRLKRQWKKEGREWLRV